MRTRQPRFYELARIARVSPATVSRVAAGLKTVDPDIRAKVRTAAAKLGIDLEKRRDDSNRVIAFVFANRELSGTFQARVLAGAEGYASTHGWELVFLTFRYSVNVAAGDLHLPQILTRRSPARGVIVTGSNSVSFLQALRDREIPFTVLGNNLLGPLAQPAESHWDMVCSDDDQGAYDATRYLITHGHRHIWFIGDDRRPWYVVRGQAYRRAMAEAGLEPRVIELHSDAAQLGFLGAKSILSRREPVTAIFASGDEVAHGVYNALRGADITIGRDISVVGFGDTLAPTFFPALTSVRKFPEELGRHLAEFTINRIKNPSSPLRQLVIPTQLMVRESVASLIPAASRQSASLPDDPRAATAQECTSPYLSE